MGRDPSDNDAHVRVQFCTVADARYFPGLVALVNSLRLLGHHDPISVLDLGLTDAQRAALAPECGFVAPPPGPPRHPWLYEPYACVGSSADVVVYVDADVIVTRPLDDLLERARTGEIVAFPDEQSDRWFAAWEDVFSLSASVRHQPYVNAGFLAVSPLHHPDLLSEWARCCDRMIGCANTRDDPDLVSSPVGLSSQDALNAVLMSEVPADALAMPLAGVGIDKRELHLVEVVDRRTLECTFAGRRPALLHYWGVRKTWQVTPRRYGPNVYNTFLRRLLAADDVAVRIDPHEVPRWLRPGLTGHLTYRMLQHVLPAARSVARQLGRGRAQPVVATANR